MPAKGWNRAAAMAELPPEYRTVFGVPPEPWPALPDGYVFGPEWEPAGTTYLFDEASAINRFAEHGSTWAEVLKHLGGLTRLIDGSATWRVPVRYARLQVHASLPGPEEVIHSIALRPTDESVNVSGQVLHDLAAAVAGYFTTWLSTSEVGPNLSSELVYDYINISYIEQTTGTDKDGKGGDQKTLVPTIQVPFSPAKHAGGAAALLPYEVSCCLTLNTDTRGPSTRGRLYLAGLTTDFLGTEGMFATTKTRGVAARFGDSIIQPIHDNTTWRFNIISRRHATGREVQGVSVGQVPDSQRRRRNALQEANFQAWGTPAGAIPPS